MLSLQLPVLSIRQGHEYATSCPAMDGIVEVFQGHLICIAVDNEGTKFFKRIELKVSRSATYFGLTVLLDKVRPPFASELEVEEYPMHTRRIAA